MKWIVVSLAVAAAAGYAHHRRSGPTFPVAGAGAGAEVRFDIVDVSVDHLAELHEPSYGATVVELTLENCRACARFEMQLEHLRSARPDLSLVQVWVPSRASGPEGEQMMEQLDRVGLCGFPHVVVLADDGSVLAEDRCEPGQTKRRDGLDYVTRWIDESS